MTQMLPDNIQKDLEKLRSLHQRATSDHNQCQEFSKLMSTLLSELEDNGYFDMADKVMSILLDCNPKIGAHCDKATIVSQKMTKLK